MIILIPARAGSKRLPNKNQQLVPGLMTLVDCIGFPRDEVILSTDDPVLVKMAKEWACRVRIRPAHLSMDDAGMAGVALDAAEFVGMADTDHFLLLQPTSPLRSMKDILEAIELYRQMREHACIESLVSACRVSQCPSTIIDQDNGNRPVAARPGRYLFINGAVYICTVSFIRTHGSFYVPGKSELFIMPKYRSIDVNDQEDYEHAVLTQRGKNNA